MSKLVPIPRLPRAPLVPAPVSPPLAVAQAVVTVAESAVQVGHHWAHERHATKLHEQEVQRAWAMVHERVARTQADWSVSQQHWAYAIERLQVTRDPHEQERLLHILEQIPRHERERMAEHLRPFLPYNRRQLAGF
jgi:hypothetical protein